MKGFRGYYKGLRVFIRSEYEEYHSHMTEVDRLGELIGIYSDSIYQAMIKAEAIDEKLLYTRHSYFLDNKLSSGRDFKKLWVPYQSGYIHEITGEYVVGDKPFRDSTPCWSKTGLRNYENRVTQAINSSIAACFLFEVFLGLIGGLND